MPTVVGVDAHKRSHTLVAVDAVGVKLGEKTVPSTTAGHWRALSFVHADFGTDVVWGVEDCRPLTARLERDLLAAGQRVIRVPPHLMSRDRASSRTPGKSDPIDALAVARAVLREPDLPVAFHDQASLELKMLVDRREDLVGVEGRDDQSAAVAGPRTRPEAAQADQLAAKKDAAHHGIVALHPDGVAGRADPR
jgi:transposase